MCTVYSVARKLVYECVTVPHCELSKYIDKVKIKVLWVRLRNPDHSSSSQCRAQYRTECDTLNTVSVIAVCTAT